MKHLANWIAIVLTVGLVCGCETTTPTGQSASSAYIHPFTKFSFPKTVGAFQRVEIQKYDREGKDVGVGYNASTPIAATVFVYPGPKDFTLLPAPKSEGVSESLLTQHFEQCKRDVFHAHTDAKLLNETDFTLVQSQNEFHGKKAVFSLKYTFGSSSQDSISELYVFLMEPGLKFLATDRYFVSYRISYPAAQRDPAASQTAQLMTDLTWPTK